MGEIERLETNENRWVALDALRSAAMLLGIIFHLSLSFIQEDVPWPVRDLHRHSGFDLFASFSHAFRMQLFFVISGLFAARTLERKGSLTLLQSRARRLGIPLLVFSPLLYLAMEPLWGGAYPKTPENLASLTDFSGYAGHAFYHLWFLQYLLVLIVARVALELLSARFSRIGALREAGRRFLKHALKHRHPFLLLAFPCAALMMPMPHWTLDEPFGLVPRLWVLLYFSVFFAVGGVLWRHQELLESIQRNWYRLLVGGMLLGLVCLPFRAFDHPPTPPVMLPLKFITLWLQANFSWGVSLGLIGLFLSRMRKKSVWISHFSGASYWYYIAHLPIVLWLQYLLSGLDLPILVKFPLMLATTFVLLELTFRTVVAKTPLSRIV